MSIEIMFRRVNPDAPAPTKAHDTDAAYDLCAMEDVEIEHGEWRMVGSGIALAIPHGYCAMVYPRSGQGCKGLALKNGTGVIDANYRGEVMLPLVNTNGDGTIRVRKGDRVAQMRIEVVPDTSLVEVEELDDTDRGAGGFGSTGVRDKSLEIEVDRLKVENYKLRTLARGLYQCACSRPNPGCRGCPLKDDGKCTARSKALALGIEVNE